MAKSIGKTVAAVVILSSVALSCAATAISIGALTKNEIDWGEGQTSSVPESAAQARSIVSIEKTETLGLVDKYTITYSDGTTSVFLVTNGKDGEPGIQGLPGPDGRVPTITIGTNGNWFVDGVDQNIRAEGLQGPKGDPGKGIEKIEKTNTYGLIDEYTITYTDNTTYVFLVTNGQDGQQGIQGIQGPDGHTPAIEIGANGNWFIDNVDSGVSATGQAGPAGQNGKSAYELAVEKGYEGTLEEWLLSLVGAAGAVGPSGQNGKSAYELAAEKGYEGTEVEWLTTLVGAAGQDGQNGTNGMSAYQIYCENHLDPDLEEDEWLASLYGQNGVDGKSAYEIYITLNPTSTLSESEWLESLVGQNGRDGRGITSITGPETEGLFDTYTIHYTDSTASTFVVRNGANGANGASLLTGAADPEALDGNSGDSYINTVTWEYFVKDGTGWVSKGSIKGEQGIAGQDGQNGTDGTNGTNGINGLNGKSLHADDGMPDSELGADGDSYIDVSTGDYYLKNAGTWQNIGNIKGAQGDEGAAGRSITTISKTGESETTDTYTIAFSYGETYSYTIAKPRSIVSITKTSTSNNVDTYTITYSYGDPSTFTVTNGINGHDGIDGQDGRDGVDGKTIYHGETTPDNGIGAQGDVYIDTVHFNMFIKGMTEWGEAIHFKGDAGADGRGITLIEKTSTSGKVDTYTITYSDTTTSTFTVTNGMDGKDGTKVVSGSSLPATFEGYQEGDSFINTTNWNYYVLVLNGSEYEWELRGNIQGAAGQNGANGTNGTNGINGKDGTKMSTGDVAPSETTGYQAGDSYLDTSTWDFYVLEEGSGSTLTWVQKGNIHSSPVSYTVSFESNGGSAVASADDVVEGTKLTKPADPTKAGYYFQGWYTAEGNKWAFEKDVVTDDITLLARWGQLEVTNGVLTGCSLSGDLEIPYIYNGQVIEGIAADVFKNRTDITSITLPNSVTEIDQGAFSGCTNLIKVTLPDGLLEIPESCFSGCSNLVDVMLPSDLETIGVSAFNGCSKLESIAFPKSVEVIGTSAFSNCTKLKYVVFPEDSAMNTIGSGAFQNCTSLTDFVYPEGVTRLRASTFEGCTNLATLSIVNLKYDSGDPTIARLFDGTSTPASLKTLIIRGSEQIKANAFVGASSITTLVVSSAPIANKGLKGLDNIENLTTRYIGSGQYTNNFLGWFFDDTTEGVDNNSSVPASLKSFTATNPGYVGIYGFYGCANLERLVLGPTLEQFSLSGGVSHALEGCTGLKYYEAPFVGSGNTTNDIQRTMGFVFGIESVDADMSAYSNLEEVVFTGHSTFNQIVEGCFENWTSIKKVTLPETGVKYLYDGAFYNCGVEELIIPNSVISIAESAFQGAASLKHVKLPQNSSITTVRDSLFENLTSLETVEMPDTITSIGQYAFSGCVKLKNIVFPANLVTIDRYAFKNCRSLTGIVLPNSVTTFGSNTFQDCTALKAVKLPDNCTSLSYCMFGGCSSLVDIVLPETLTKIHSHLFSGCKSLRIINMPDEVTEIGSYAFAQCISLSNIHIPKKCALIEYYAFEDCVALTALHGLDTIDNSVSLRTIDGFAFAGCRSLSSLYLMSYRDITFKSGAFSGCDALSTVIVNCFGGTVTFKTSFAGCDGLKYVYIDASGTAVKLQSGAFRQCQSLTSVHFMGNGIVLEDGTSDRDGCFYKCMTLSTVLNDSDSLYIGDYAFADCPMLEQFINSFEFHGSISDIGRYAFQNCKKLSSFEFKDVHSVKNGAFKGCSSLKEITIVFSIMSVSTAAFDGLTFDKITSDLSETMYLDWLENFVDPTGNAALYPTNNPGTTFVYDYPAQP